MACNLLYKYSSEWAVTVTVNEGIHHGQFTDVQPSGQVQPIYVRASPFSTCFPR